MNQFFRLVPLLACLAITPMAFGENEGMEDLDRAFDRKMNVQRGRDLERVVQLCESALDKGLDEGNAALARSILSGTLYERANGFVADILEGEFDRNWVRRRQLALIDLNRAAAGNPDDGEVQLLVARLEGLPGGDPDEGKAAAKRATELLKDSPPRQSIAFVARAAFQKDPAARMSDYGEAIRLDKSNGLAWRERGRAKLASGKANEAIDDFLHLLEEDPSDTQSLRLAAEALSGLGEFSKARKHLDRLIELNPKSPGGYTLRARVLMMQEDFDGAVVDLDQALKIEPKDLLALMMRAQLNMNRNKAKETVDDLNQVLQLRPGMPQAILLRSIAHTANENFPAAITDLERLLQGDPDNTGLLLQIGGVYSLDQRPRKAIKIYTDILERDAKNWEALQSRADTYLNIGKHKEAIVDYEKLVAEKPDDSSVLNNFAWVLATSKNDEVRDGKRALEIAVKACEVTEYKAAHIVSTLASAHAELGDFDKAVEWSQKAVDLGTGEVKEQLKEELNTYKAGKPWRELQVVEEKPEPPGPSADDLLIDDDEEAAAPTPQPETAPGS